MCELQHRSVSSCLSHYLKWVCFHPCLHMLAGHQLLGAPVSQSSPRAQTRAAASGFHVGPGGSNSGPLACTAWEPSPEPHISVQSQFVNICWKMCDLYCAHCGQALPHLSSYHGTTHTTFPSPDCEATLCWIQGFRLTRLRDGLNSDHRGMVGLLATAASDHYTTFQD